MMRDDNYRQKQEQDEREYLEFADKPICLDEIDYQEARKRHAQLIKTIFDREE